MLFFIHKCTGILLSNYYPVDVSHTHLNPLVALWLHYTAHCTEKIYVVSVHLHPGSASAERVEMGGVTHRVTCTWWQLGLALKASWLRLGCMDKLRKRYAHLVGGGRGFERALENNRDCGLLHAH